MRFCSTMIYSNLRATQKTCPSLCMLSIRGTAGGGRRGVFSPRGTAFVSPLKIGPLEGSIKSAFNNSGTTTQNYCGVRGEFTG